MEEHDGSYRQFFSSPRMVKDLLTGFIHDDWVSELDFNEMEAVETSFVSDALRKREADVIWRIKWQDRWLYVYVLIEMQSKVDPMMAVRLLTYIGLLYQDLAAQKKLTDEGLLPPVLPITIYNGNQPWSAPTKLKDMIAHVPKALQRYQPNLSYFLLDEARLSEDALPETPNLVSSLIKLENSQDSKSLSEALDELITSVQQNTPELTRLRRTFSIWLGRSLIPARYKGVELPNLNDLLEIKDMLAERVTEWTKEWHQQGLNEGIEKGIEKGREEGKEEVARTMIRGGFETEVIHQATGLSLEAIEALRAEIF